MEYDEENFLQISGLQHYCFCKRQWALIHIEQLWSENLRTVEGEIMHQKAHDYTEKESRKGVLITRDLKIHSTKMGLSGACDVVEFYPDSQGIALLNKTGKYLPYPVEYKRGEPRHDHANELQLCAQAMCLEEMLCCDVNKGALFFGEIRHREEIIFNSELREEVKNYAKEMHQLYEKSHTPKVKPTKSCNACSLKEVCVPKLLKNKSVKEYITDHLKE